MLAAVGRSAARARSASSARSTVSATLIPFVLAGAFLVLAYDLELLGGRFHNDWWFALGVGRLPRADRLLGLRAALRVAGRARRRGCTLLSLAQRRLSTPVRELRRRTVVGGGRAALGDGRVLELTAARLLAPLEGALRALWFALVLLAVGLVVLRA